ETYSTKGFGGIMMKKNRDKHLHTLTNNYFKNITTHFLRKYPALIAIPFFLFILYSYYLYERVFLPFNQMSFAQGENFLLGNSLFLILSFKNILLLIVILVLITVIYFNHMVQQIYYRPIPAMKKLSVSENFFLKITFFPFLSYLVVLAATLNIRLFEKLLYPIITIIFFIILFKFLNLIILILSILTTKILSKTKIPFTYFFIIYLLLFYGILIQFLNWVQVDFTMNYFYLVLCMFFCLLGRLALGLYFNNFFTLGYLLRYPSRKKSSKVISDLIPRS